jgi:TetR/AcrR family transcriptional regulator, tetracycline repressor protein
MRPKVPLISKRDVCQTALRMIDENGIDNFSVRRLASEVGVNAASFYHHFDNKEAILAGAAQLALAEVRTPASSSEDWQVWFLRNTLTLHKVLRRHPELIEIVLRRNLFRLGLPEIEKTYALLEQQGLPVGLTTTLMESLEAFVAGHLMLERFGDSDLGQHIADYPTVQRAYAERILSADQAFELGCRKLIQGIAEAAAMTDMTGRTDARKPGQSASRKASGAPAARTASRSRAASTAAARP